MGQGEWLYFLRRKVYTNGTSEWDYVMRSWVSSPTVFDTGRLLPGGRCSSRYPNDKPKDRSLNQSSILSQYTIDHAAQILVVPGVRGDDDGFYSFQKQVNQCREDGVILQFPCIPVCKSLQKILLSLLLRQIIMIIIRIKRHPWFVISIVKTCITAMMDLDPVRSIWQPQMRSRSSRMCGYLHPVESNMLEKRRLHSGQCSRHCA